MVDACQFQVHSELMILCFRPLHAFLVLRRVGTDESKVGPALLDSASSADIAAGCSKKVKVMY